MAERTVHPTLRSEVPQRLGASDAQLHGRAHGARHASAGRVRGQRRTPAQTGQQEAVHRGQAPPCLVSVGAVIVSGAQHWLKISLESGTRCRHLPLSRYLSALPCVCGLWWGASPPLPQLSDSVPRGAPQASLSLFSVKSLPASTVYSVLPSRL